MNKKIEEAHAEISGRTVALIGIEFSRHFRDVYPASVIANYLAVGPLQSLIGLAIMNGHLKLGDAE